MKPEEIVERLRRCRPLQGQSLQELMDQAADEIERLQGIIENMREIRTTLALGVDP